MNLIKRGGIMFGDLFLGDFSNCDYEINHCSRILQILWEYFLIFGFRPKEKISTHCPIKFCSIPLEFCSIPLSVQMAGKDVLEFFLSFIGLEKLRK
jgi:hypothetical protein